MISTTEIYDLLLVESSPEMNGIFKEISRIFNLKILFANNIKEFIELVTQYEFRFVLSNLHIEYKFAGLFISRMYSNIRKIKTNDGKMFMYSLQNNPKFELAKLILDDFAEQKYPSFYDFLRTNFPLHFFNYFTTDEFKQSVAAAI